MQKSVTGYRCTLPDAQVRYQIHLHLVTDVHELSLQTATLALALPRARLRYGFRTLRQFPE
jgi:hypothetical protein